MSSPVLNSQRRLFFALAPSGLGESRSLHEVLKKIKKGADQRELESRWIKPDCWHITTNFIGNTLGDRIPELIEVGRLVAGRHARFSLHLRQVSAFPEVAAARVIWIGVAGTKPLTHLQADMGEALAAKGWPRAVEDFIPHMTIGRLRQGRNIKDLLSPVVRRDIGEFMAEEMVLFESQVFGQHVVYTALARLPLGANDSSQQGRQV